MTGRGKNYQYSQSCQENGIYDVGVSAGGVMGKEDLGWMKKNKNRFRKQEFVILKAYG